MDHQTSRRSGGGKPQGDTSVQEPARLLGLTVAEIEQWEERSLARAENALRRRPLDEEERICRLQ